MREEGHPPSPPALLNTLSPRSSLSPRWQQAKSLSGRGGGGIHQELFHLHDTANVDVDDIEAVDFDFDVDIVDVDVLLLMLLLCWPGGGGAPDSVRPGEERRGEESVLGGSSQGPPCEM